MCVASCPTASYSPLAAALANIETEAAIKEKVAPFCAPEMANLVNLSVKQLVDQAICPEWYLSSKELLGRCLPNVSQGEEDEPVQVNQTQLEQGRHRYSSFLAVRQLGERVFSDLQETYWMIGIALLGACLLSLLWIVLMRYVAGPLIYTSILAVFLGLVGLLVFCSVRLYHSWFSTDPAAHKNIFQLNWTPEIVDDFMKQKNTWLAFTCILSILLFACLCLFAFLWKRIRIAVALIKEASAAVGQLCSALFFPLIPFLLQVTESIKFVMMLFCRFWLLSGSLQLPSLSPRGVNLSTDCQVWNPAAHQPAWPPAQAPTTPWPTSAPLIPSPSASSSAQRSSASL